MEVVQVLLRDRVGNFFNFARPGMAGITFRRYLHPTAKDRGL